MATASCKIMIVFNEKLVLPHTGLNPNSIPHLPFPSKSQSRKLSNWCQKMCHVDTRRKQIPTTLFRHKYINSLNSLSQCHWSSSVESEGFKFFATDTSKRQNQKLRTTRPWKLWCDYYESINPLKFILTLIELVSLMTLLMSFASPLSFQGLCWKTIPSPAQLYKVTEGCSFSSPIQQRKRANYTLFFLTLHRTNLSHYKSKHYFKKQYTSFNCLWSSSWKFSTL